MKGGCLFRQPPFFGDVMWKKGNVLKNGWWLFEFYFLIKIIPVVYDSKNKVLYRDEVSLNLSINEI